MEEELEVVQHEGLAWNVHFHEEGCGKNWEGNIFMSQVAKVEFGIDES